MLSTVLEVIVITSFGAVFYSYVLYPFVLAIIAGVVQTWRDARYVLRKLDRRITREPELPEVAVVISAFNEERYLQARIDNLLELDYPAEKLSIYIGSDGSRDATGTILQACSDTRLKAFVFEQNRGKANVLNDLVSRTQAPILVFSDANTFFAPNALKAMVVHFSDPGVGGVSGELRLKGAAGDNQDSLYWRVEQFLKFFEARIGGLLGANGAIYAIRRALWKPLASDTICDDFCVGMNVAAAGHRLVYEPTAWAEEDTPDAIEEEFKRRVRIGIGNFQALMRQPEYFYRTSAGTAFAYLSHKVLRWIAPHLILIGVAVSFVLALDSPVWVCMLLLELAGIAVGAGLYALSGKGRRLPGLLRIVAFLYALNWAFLVASWRYARGNYSGSWRRTAR
jgi:cellulose synthase/poly-beta-1,6-N-acetylglucosamine synthase-like glycosyltransferase